MRAPAPSVKRFGGLMPLKAAVQVCDFSHSKHVEVDSTFWELVNDSSSELVNRTAKWPRFYPGSSCCLSLVKLDSAALSVVMRTGSEPINIKYGLFRSPSSPSMSLPTYVSNWRCIAGRRGELYVSSPIPEATTQPGRLAKVKADMEENVKSDEAPSYSPHVAASKGNYLLPTYWVRYTFANQWTMRQASALTMAALLAQQDTLQVKEHYMPLFNSYVTPNGQLKILPLEKKKPYCDHYDRIVTCDTCRNWYLALRILGWLPATAPSAAMEEAADFIVSLIAGSPTLEEAMNHPFVQEFRPSQSPAASELPPTQAEAGTDAAGTDGVCELTGLPNSK